MPERNTEIFEMLIAQVGENGHINVVLVEPVRNLLHRSHQRHPSRLIEFSTTATRVYTAKFAMARPFGVEGQTVDRANPGLTKWRLAASRAADNK